MLPWAFLAHVQHLHGAEGALAKHANTIAHGSRSGGETGLCFLLSKLCCRTLKWYAHSIVRWCPQAWHQCISGRVARFQLGGGGVRYSPLARPPSTPKKGSIDGPPKSYQD